nr:hypothetical protein [Tanacetum cinerariifolium]
GGRLLMRRKQPRRWRGSGCCHGEGGSVVLSAAAAVVAAGGGVNEAVALVDRGVVVAAVAVGLWMVGWRVEASDIVDRVDRVIRILFGFAGKSPPEKFSGGGVVAGWAAAAGGRRWEEGDGKMSTWRQGMTSAEIDQIVAQRVTDTIEAIAVYEAKICMDHNSMNQVMRQRKIVEKNANNKRKFKNQPKDNCVPQNYPSRNRMWQGLTLLDPMKRRLMLRIYLTATSVSCIMLDRVL